jgi:hypothetical protein
VKRASKHGKFRYLYSKKILVSVRRLDKRGRVRIVLDCIKVQFSFFFKKRVQRKVIDYEYFETSKKKR